MKRSAISLLAIVILITPLFCTIDPTSAVNNPTDNYWINKAPMNQPRAGLGVVAVDGKIYAIGGATTPHIGNLLSINEQYDPTTNTWTIKPSMHTPGAYFAIAAYQHKIYCIGGIVGSESFFDGFMTHSTYVYSKSLCLLDRPMPPLKTPKK